MVAAPVRLKVVSVDPSRGAIEVTLPSGEVAFVPAPAAPYKSDAWVVMDGAQPLFALGPVAVGNGLVGGNISGSVTGGRADIDLLYDGGKVNLPLLAGTYSAGDGMWVGTNAWGIPNVAAEWQSSALASTATEAPSNNTGNASSGGADVGKVVADRRQFAASSAGTYRVSKGNWNSWNTGRYGWPNNAYQGSSYGSGTLYGVFGFGDQVAALGALSITAITLSATRADGTGGAVAMAAVGIADGAAGGGAPAGLTAGYTGNAVGAGGGSWVGMGPDVLAGMRTGAVKGFALVGGYSAWVGAMLTVDFTRSA